MTIQELINVNTVFLTIFKYPMSYVEFFGTIFTAWSVYLAAKNKILTWPISIIGIILYTFLFFQVRLYSDFIEQIYYFFTSFWGWWLWTHPKKSESKQDSKELKVCYTKKNINIIVILFIILSTIGLGYLMTDIHIIMPTIFTVAASFPYLDAFTTIMSFVATIYLAKRRIENWYLWIIVDIIGIWLYYQKGVVFISILYFAFLINAVMGYLQWTRIYKRYAK